MRMFHEFGRSRDIDEIHEVEELHRIPQWDDDEDRRIKNAKRRVLRQMTQLDYDEIVRRQVREIMHH